MITITKDAKVPENDNLKVYSQSGDYADNDLIECYNIDDPSVPICAYTAAYVRYGGIIFKYGNPEALGEALLAIDPDSTHDAVIYYKEELARRLKRERGDFSPENPVPADEDVSKIQAEANKLEEKQEVKVEEKKEVDSKESKPNPVSPTPGSSSDYIIDRSTTTGGPSGMIVPKKKRKLG